MQGTMLCKLYEQGRVWQSLAGTASSLPSLHTFQLWTNAFAKPSVILAYRNTTFTGFLSSLAEIYRCSKTSSMKGALTKYLSISFFTTYCSRYNQPARNIYRYSKQPLRTSSYFGDLEPHSSCSESIQATRMKGNLDIILRSQERLAAQHQVDIHIQRGLLDVPKK